MADGDFRFDPTGIGQLLRKGSLLVPANQRSYAWRGKHVRNLLADLNTAVSGRDATDDYFLGTVVLVQSPDAMPAIVDGQQRLATASIILARIRDAFTELGRDGSARAVQEAFLGHTDPRTEELVSRLRLNDEDNQFFSEVILAPQLTDEAVEEQRHAQLRPSNRRLARASKIAREYIESVLSPLPPEQRPDTLLRWHDFIDSKARILAVYVPNEVSAFRMFETLNDRGLRASQADILKNYFFSQAGKRLDEAKTMWTSMAAKIEVPVTDDIDDETDDENRNDPVVTYIRHSWITTHGPTKVRELAAEIRREVTNDTRSLAFLSECSKAAGDYMALSNSKDAKWADYSPAARNHIETIAEHLRVEQIKPLLFAVARHFDPAEAEKAFKLFVSWSVRFLIYGGRGGMLDTQYSNRAKEVGTREITKARELREKMKNYVPNDDEFRGAFATARVSRPHLARYYLRALERQTKHLPQSAYVAAEELAKVTLEHVLPLEPGPKWNVDSETAQAAQKLLGNMALVRDVDNLRMANGEFGAKKPTLAGTGLNLTKMISDYESWGIDQIRDRQAKLADLAVKTWSLDLAE